MHLTPEIAEKYLKEDFPGTPLESGILARMGRDLTVLAKKGKLPPIHGFTREVGQLTEILGRKTNPNPIVLGEAGVGKTTLVEKLAQTIIEQGTKLPHWLRSSKIVEISYVTLASATSTNWSEYLENIRRAFEEAKDKPIILFIDEIHQLWAFPISFSQVKPLISRGDVRIIGATTLSEYHRFLETESALNRRFFPVYLEEPDRAKIIEILHELAPFYEVEYGVPYDETSLEKIADLTEIYLSNYRQPAISIDILESAFVRQRVQRKRWMYVMVDEPVIKEIIAERAKIPFDDIEELSHKFTDMETEINRQLFGQEKIVKKVIERILVSKSHLDIKPEQPDGIFLFAGPPGVGKTELAGILAQKLTGKEEGLIQLNMAQFSDSSSIRHLLRNPKHDTESHSGNVPFLEKVRNYPHGVALLDEIDKAHPAVWNFFLKIFDEGQVEDEYGIRTDFSNLTIIMTTNIGYDYAAGKKRVIGLRADKEQAQLQLNKEQAQKLIFRHFPREFLNRIDHILHFNNLQEADLLNILDYRREKYGAALRKEIVLTKQAKKLILQKCNAKRDNARNLLRVMNDLLASELMFFKNSLKNEAEWENIRIIRLGREENELRVMRWL